MSKVTNDVISALFNEAALALEGEYVHGERQSNVLASLIIRAVRDYGWQVDPSTYKDRPWAENAFAIAGRLGYSPALPPESERARNVK